MVTTITPTYRDIFQEEKPSLDSLLQNISLDFVISYLAYINAQLFSRSHSVAEKEILSFFSAGLPEEQETKFFLRIKSIHSKNKPETVSFFSILASMHLMHHSLLTLQRKDLPQPSPVEKFNFLKAYFVQVEELSDRNNQIFEDRQYSDDDFFRTRTWPLLSEQFQANRNTNIVFNLIRGFTLLVYFEREENLKKHLNIFLAHYERANPWHYLESLMDLLQINWSNEKENPIRPFFLLADKTEPFLEKFVLDINDYKRNFRKDKRNFNGLKENPLFKSKNTYIVLNWDYVVNKTYEGLVYDFYKYSEIKTIFKSFVDFKNHISYNFSEKYILRRIFRAIFNSRFSVLNFFEDGPDKEGMPDAYYRSGRYIYIFELKDAYFPAAAVGSYSFEKIKSAIDQKYNSPSKGVAQIIEQLEKLKFGPFEDKSYEQLKLKIRNLIVYPIIIYTDNSFGMPGFNNYLNDVFQKQLKQRNLASSFSQVKNLSFVHLSFFFENIEKLKRENLGRHLDAYHAYIKKWTRSHNKNPEMNALFEMNDSFENFFYKKIDTRGLKKKNFLKDIFKILELPTTYTSES